MRDRINNYVAVVIGRLCFLFYHLEIQNFWQVTVSFHYSLPLPLPQLCVKIYEDYEKKMVVVDLQGIQNQGSMKNRAHI